MVRKLTGTGYLLFGFHLLLCGTFVTFASEIKPKIYEVRRNLSVSSIIWRPTNQGGYFCCKDMIGMWVCLMAKKEKCGKSPLPSDDEQQNFDSPGGNASTSFPREPRVEAGCVQGHSFVAEPGSDFSTEPFTFQCLPWSILGDKHVWEAACQRAWYPRPRPT